MPQPLPNNPRDLLLGPDNDLVIGSDAQWTYGVDAVAQSCRIALQMFEGEWFLDLGVGIPYWDEILGKKPELAIPAATAAFRDELLAVDGVLSVVRLNVEYVGQTRTMSVTWQVSTALGNTPVDTIALAIGGASA